MLLKPEYWGSKLRSPHVFHYRCSIENLLYLVSPSGIHLQDTVKLSFAAFASRDFKALHWFNSLCNPTSTIISNWPTFLSRNANKSNNQKLDVDMGQQMILCLTNDHINPRKYAQTRNFNASSFYDGRAKFQIQNGIFTFQKMETIDQNSGNKILSVLLSALVVEFFFIGIHWLQTYKKHLIELSLYFDQ